MTKCCIRGCNSDSRKNEDGLSFFRFPKNEALRKIWTDNIGDKNIKPTTVLRICSRHFEENDVNRTLDVVRLKDDVIPTLFPFTSSVKSRVKLSMKTANTGNATVFQEVSDAKTTKIKKLTNHVIQQRKKIKVLSQKCRRLQHRVLRYQALIAELNSKNLISCEGAILLEECASHQISKHKGET